DREGHAPIAVRDWAETFQYDLISDLDGDGIPDSVVVEGPNDAHVTFGAYKEPHVLLRAETEAGRATTISYVPANKSWPSGEIDEDQLLHMSFALPFEVATDDWVTELSALSTYTFEFGHMTD